MNIKNRKKAEELIYSTLDKLDNSGMNSDKYKKLFAKMTDSQFVAFCTKLRDDPNMNFYVECDLYGKNKITMDNINSAAKHLGVPLEEYVYIKHLTDDGTEVRTPFQVPVMYIHLKRMQQLLSKKNKANVDIDSGNVRSRITGALNQDNKSGKFTDMDTQALISVTGEAGLGGDILEKNQSPIVFELLGARGDNNKTRMALNQSISLFGSASLKNVYQIATKNGKEPYTTGQSSATFDIFMIGAGMKTDIRDQSYLIKQGAKQ